MGMKWRYERESHEMRKRKKEWDGD